MGNESRHKNASAMLQLARTPPAHLSVCGCHHQHNNSYMHSSQNLASSANHCCLRTTSFMAAAPSPNCICCERELKGGSSGATGGCGSLVRASSNEYALDGPEAIYNTEQRKSRTLTRVYKPLNDIQFPDTSTNTNLMDNFYIPSADHAQSSTNNNHL